VLAGSHGVGVMIGVVLGNIFLWILIGAVAGLALVWPEDAESNVEPSAPNRPGVPY
jgi:hypothetical protein